MCGDSMSSSKHENENYAYEGNADLISDFKRGDKSALKKIYELNMSLVATISKRFLNRGYDYEDIFQIGCVGLIKAVNNFNPNFNVKFSTYAVPMIMGEIKRFLRDDGIIKISRNVKSIAKKLHFDREQLTKELNREPTLDELAMYSKISSEEILYVTESVSSIQYLFDVIHQDDGAPVLLIDKLSQESAEDSKLIENLELKNALKHLDAESRRIIILRYFKDKTQVEVANMIGISQVQVSRIEKKILFILREYMK